MLPLPAPSRGQSSPERSSTLSWSPAQTTPLFDADGTTQFSAGDLFLLKVAGGAPG